MTNHNHRTSIYYRANVVLLSIIGIIILFILYSRYGYIIEKLPDLPRQEKEKATVWIPAATTTSINTIATTTATTSDDNIVKKYHKYVKVIDSCGVHYDGACVRARACPSLSCNTLTSLRTGMVLMTDGETTEQDGKTWYHVIFGEWVRYPERTANDWYVAADYVELLDSYTESYTKSPSTYSINKKIIIDLGDQTLSAYEGDELFMQVSISSGLDDLPTPRGTFHIFEKTPSRYMQGPLPGISDQYYDLPGVPWTMYFTKQGAAIHGAYWHDNFGTQWSHGCVNLRPEDSERLYYWAELGTKVIVRD